MNSGMMEISSGLEIVGVRANPIMPFGRCRKSLPSSVSPSDLGEHIYLQTANTSLHCNPEPSLVNGTCLISNLPTYSSFLGPNKGTVAMRGDMEMYDMQILYK